MAPPPGRPPELIRLRRRWALLWGAATALVAVGAWALSASRPLGACLQWGLQAALVVFFVFARTGPALTLNHPLGGGTLSPAIGLANGVSLARAFMLAVVAGFIALPEPAGSAPEWLGWAPGVLYLCASALDCADGYLARTTGTETRLGEYLDTEIDATGMMVASLYLVFAGKAPWVYLLAGGGYFALRAAVRLRRRAGRPVQAVAGRPAARLAAGFAMGFGGAAMLPVCAPAAARLGAVVVTMVLLEGFARDWLVVCGKASADGTPRAGRLARLEAAAARTLPLVLRAGILAAAGGVLAASAFGMGPAGRPAPQAVWLMACAAACALGLAPRAAAMLLSVVSAGWMGSAAAGPEAAVLLSCALALAVTGAGAFCLWRPEERLLLERHGTRRGAQKDRKAAGRL